MKIVMNLPVEASVFFNQLQQSAMADIRQHTGREPLPKSLQGFSYEKNWPNGRKARLTITEHQIQSTHMNWRPRVMTLPCATTCRRCLPEKVDWFMKKHSSPGPLVVQRTTGLADSF